MLLSLCTCFGVLKKVILTLGISDPGTIFDIFVFLTEVFWFFFFFENTAEFF